MKDSCLEALISSTSVLYPEKIMAYSKDFHLLLQAPYFA